MSSNSERMLELVEEDDDDTDEEPRSRVTWTINNYKNKRSKKLGNIDASSRTVFNFIPRQSQPLADPTQIEHYYRTLRKKQTNGVHEEQELFPVQGQLTQEAKLDEEALAQMTPHEYSEYYRKKKDQLLSPGFGL